VNQHLAAGKTTVERMDGFQCFPLVAGQGWGGPIRHRQSRSAVVAGVLAFTAAAQSLAYLSPILAVVRFPAVIGAERNDIAHVVEPLLAERNYMMSLEENFPVRGFKSGCATPLTLAVSS
jgi:hypothetical protein